MRGFLLAIVATVQALRVGPPAHVSGPLGAALASSNGVRWTAGPAPSIAKPKTIIKQRTFGAGGDGGGGQGPAGPQLAPPLRAQQTEDVPMWKVILLGDSDYEEDPVCEVLKGVIPEIGNDREAKMKYDECQATGKALLIIVPKEHAEGYVEQLARADPEMIVYAQIEEEKIGS